MSEKQLTADDILSSVELEEINVSVKEWGGKVKIKPLTKAEQQRIRKSCAKDDGSIDNEKLEMQLFIGGVVEPKFTEDQIPALRELNANAIDKVLTKIMSVSGLADEEELKKIKKSST